MRHHEVNLQLCQLVGVYAYLAERTEASSHAIDGFFTFGNLTVEVFTTADDALTGVLAQFQLIVVLNDLFYLVKGQMTRTYLVYHRAYRIL